MKIRIIDDIKLQVVEGKDYMYKHLIRYYNMIYTDFSYGCIPVINDLIYLDGGYLVTTRHLPCCLRYNEEMYFIDLKTKEIMIRIRN